MEHYSHLIVQQCCGVHLANSESELSYDSKSVHSVASQPQVGTFRKLTVYLKCTYIPKCTDKTEVPIDHSCV